MRRLRVGAAIGLAVSLLAAACGLISGIDGLDFVPECTTAAACDDHDPCTVDSCDADAGVCAHAKAATGTHCAVEGGRVCDDHGRCVACNVDEDCPGSTDDCQRPACRADHTCGAIYADAGTPTKAKPQQAAGDCHVLLCDGDGGVVSQVDDGDLPDDSNDCTADDCASGVPSHMQLPAGTICGDGTLACDTSGQCAGCTVDAQCSPPQTCGGGGTPAACGCTKTTCPALAIQCGTWPDGCGGTLVCDDLATNGDETDVDCGGPSCPSCAQAKKCKVSGDCAAGLSCADGVCCDAPCTGPCVSCALPGLVGTCTPIAADTPDPAGGCNSPKTCNGAGQCLVALGQNCTADAQCVTGTCADGVCCESKCTGICRACNLPGMSGSCGFVGQGFPDTNCSAANSTCDGVGGCKLALGQPCTADAQCAFGACAGTCKLPLGHACTLSSECASGACNVVCKLAIGQTCVASTDCASGHCADGVCCNSGCGGQCRACNVAGSVGTCALVPAGTQDPACTGGSCAADGGCM